jgi:uridine kinase
LPLEERLKLNFDHPESIDFELLIEHLQQLREGKSVEQPTYSYITCTRGEETVKVEPAQIIIIEGILIFTNSELRKLLDILVYVDADPDDRLVRVISRDIIERGKSVENVLERYEKTVKPMHLQFIEPTKRYADLILPQGGHNKVGIDILIATIEKAIQNS